MNSFFELQIDFKNHCNWIYGFFVKFKMSRHILLHIRYGIYGKKKPNNLHKINLFSKMHMINNEVQVIYLTGHEIFVLWAYVLAIITSHLLSLELRHVDWEFSGNGWFMIFSLAWSTGGEQSFMITTCTNQSFCHSKFEIQ